MTVAMMAMMMIMVIVMMICVDEVYCSQVAFNLERYMPMNENDFLPTLFEVRPFFLLSKLEDPQ
jgi:hypothetical protein